MNKQLNTSKYARTRRFYKLFCKTESDVLLESVGTCVSLEAEVHQLSPTPFTHFKQNIKRSKIS